MKRYPLCLLLIILTAKIFRADDDDPPDESPAEKKEYHHHCYQKNYGKCIRDFEDAYEEIQGKGEDKKKSKEVHEKIGPVQEKTFNCLNETKAKRKKCRAGFNLCAIATITFTDNTTLQTECCDEKTASNCLSFLKTEEYESYTGKKTKMINCEFCEDLDCNGGDEEGYWERLMHPFRHRIYGQKQCKKLGEN